MTFGATRKVLVSRVAFFMIAAIVVLVSSFATFAQSNSIEAPMNACSDNWDPRFLIGGPNQGSVVNSVIKNSSGTVFIAGSFTSIDGVPISRVARWNGSRWIQVGNGLNGSVQTIAFAPNGTLYAGGSFTSSDGGATLNRIARLDGSNWVAVGEGFNGGITTITFDSNGLPYVGGTFTQSGSKTIVNRVARWDGTAWQSLGTGFSGAVLTLIWTPQGLFAGGTFTATDDGRAVGRIARWDGFYWRAVGGGLNGAVRSISWDKNSLLAVGDFTQTLSPVRTLNRVARFENENWAQVGDGLNNSVLMAQRDAFDVLWIIGSFTSSGSETGLGAVARLSGSAWRRVANGVAAGFSINGITSLPNGEMVLGGTFTSANGDLGISRLARWDGENFQRMTSTGLAPNGTVNAIAEDSSGNIYIGGNFLAVGGVPANRIAKWDGRTWSTLSTGMNGTVSSLLFDSKGRLLAGGNFTTAGGVTVNRIARWNGTVWEPIGDGFNGSVQTMIFGPNGHLYVGGNFTSSGSVANLNRIARWDGTAWNPIGAGFSSTVNAIAFSPTGTIFAGGSFIVTGDRLAAYIARFDPVDGWFGIGDGMSNPVRAMAFDSNGRLYIAGDFTIADKIEVSRIVYFQNNTFTPVGAGVNGSISAMRLGSGGEIHIAGNFTASGQNTVRRFARWNGSQWTELGNGINEQVLAMLRASSGDFYLGGFFTQTGCKNSAFLGRFISNGFIGTSSTNWHTAGNWSSNSIPTATSDIRISSGSVTITSSDAVVKNLYIADGITVEIAAGRTLTVSGELTLHGRITGGGTVIIQSCEPISLERPAFSTGFVSANLRRCVDPNREYLFPLGENGAYAPVTVSNANASGTVTLSTIPQSQANATGLPTTRFNRNWVAAATGTSTADLRFGYPDASVNSVVETSARLYRTVSGSSALIPTSVDAFNNLATVKQTSLAGTWTIAQSGTSCTPILGGVPTAALSSRGAILYIEVDVPSDCVWRVVNRSNWIAVTSSSEIQGGTVIEVILPENVGPFREGVVSFGETAASFSQLTEATVGGRVVYHFGDKSVPVTGVSVTASGSIPKSAVTEADGSYFFEDLGAGAYTLSVSKSGETDAITSADASLVLMYVMGMAELTDAQKIAADVTGDGTISALDASRIARFTVGLPNSGDTGTWKFLPQSIAFPSIQGIRADQDFVAILLGDVSGNYAPSTTLEQSAKERTSESISIRSLFGGSPAFLRKTDLFPKVPTTEIRIGESLQLPITVGDLTSAEAFSFEIELEYDPSSFAVDPRNLIQTAETLSVNHRLAVNTSESGVIRIAGFGTTPFSGGGALFKLNLQPLESRAVTTPLRVVSFQLNETPVKPFLLTR